VLAALLAVVAVPVAALPSIDLKAPPAAAEQPALWVLSDVDTTIYLFGTFHALDERTDWFARNVRAAFNSSDELVLETLVPSDPVQLLAMLQRHSLATPLVAGAPVIAKAGHAMTAGRSAGLAVEHGADAILRRFAETQGKPVDGLETFDSQLNMLATLPAPLPIAAPAQAVVPPVPQAEVRRMLLDMRSAWKRGDSSRLATMLGGIEAQSPATYRRLFVDRNDHWARWIAERMERPGTVFVAVGTGHLIGRDSVQQKLSRHGFRATRIN
jgi:uncharacterized protein YbaP (TraB family)